MLDFVWINSWLQLATYRARDTCRIRAVLITGDTRCATSVSIRNREELGYQYQFKYSVTVRKSRHQLITGCPLCSSDCCNREMIHLSHHPTSSADCSAVDQPSPSQHVAVRIVKLHRQRPGTVHETREIWQARNRRAKVSLHLVKSIHKTKLIVHRALDTVLIESVGWRPRVQADAEVFGRVDCRGEVSTV